MKKLFSNKLEQVREYLKYIQGRPYFLKYLKTYRIIYRAYLFEDYKTLIKVFSSAPDDTFAPGRQYMENFHNYLIGCSHGITTLDYNEYGWYTTGNLKRKGYSENEFKNKETHVVLKSILFPNGTYAAGLSMTYNGHGTYTGHHCSPSIYDKPYPTREQALLETIKKVIKFLERCPSPEKNSVIKKLKQTAVMFKLSLESNDGSPIQINLGNIGNGVQTSMF